MVLDPSVPLRPEFLRSNLLPCASLFDLCLSHLLPPYEPVMIAIVNARMAVRLAVLDFPLPLILTKRSHDEEVDGHKCPVCRKVD